MTLSTKVGTFDVRDNENGGSILMMNGKKICEFPNVPWWDKDGLERGVADNSGLIKNRIEERLNGVSKENVEYVLEKCLEVLGNSEKGFYSARLKQCLNRLKGKKVLK